uniref:FERM domain-containing protein n=2 Tax=Macrostomum lignano TaxID=282301 RepID=A0A1I8HC90_9PLAT
EIGDFLEEEYLDTLYLTRLKVLPSPVSEELLKKVMEYHKAHVGLTPEDAEYSLLDTVRKVDLYGIRLHPARDRDSLPLSLAVAHTGVLVFQGTVRINCFNWAKVRKLSFKRKKFLVKLHPET